VPLVSYTTGMQRTRVCTLEIDEQTFTYTLRKRRGQRKLTLSVHDSGTVTVTTPIWVTRRFVESFVREKKDWLAGILRTHEFKKRPSEAEQHAHYLAHKEAARVFVTQRLQELNQVYNYKYKRISIRRNSSRWGSCSSKGTLSFDYRILFLAPHLQDYLLVHELCHLKEMNHGECFWDLVAKAIPDYKEHKRELQKTHR
jgi:predicted metal-dependent hydrolase